MLKNIVILIFFLLSISFSKDLYIFSDFQKNNSLKNYHKKQKDTNFIISKKINPIKDITKTKINKQLPIIKKNPININPYSNKNLTELLKIYKNKIDTNTTPNQNLFLAIKNKLLKKDGSIYDKIALLNALDDIQNKNINKYEASLTLETMIKEIK